MVYTVRCLYFATIEVQLIFSSSFWNPHDKQMTNLSLIFENDEVTGIIELKMTENEKDESQGSELSGRPLIVPIRRLQTKGD